LWPSHVEKKWNYSGIVELVLVVMFQPNCLIVLQFLNKTIPLKNRRFWNCQNVKIGFKDMKQK